MAEGSSKEENDGGTTFFWLFGFEVRDLVAGPKLLEIMVPFKKVKASDELICEL